MDDNHTTIKFLQYGARVNMTIDSHISNGKMDTVIGLIGNMTEEQAKATLIHRILNK